MTTLNINGKVTFVEKYGTGAANSTGSYELDPSKADTFSAAWRTMSGLKTDVFCSAGLVLPDKAGRQLNIGGWSGTSLVSQVYHLGLESLSFVRSCIEWSKTNFETSSTVSEPIGPMDLRALQAPITGKRMLPM